MMSHLTDIETIYQMMSHLTDIETIYQMISHLTGHRNNISDDVSSYWTSKQYIR